MKQTMTTLEVRKCAEDMSERLKTLEPESKDRDNICAASSELWRFYMGIGFYTYTPRELAKKVHTILEKHKVN